MKVFTLVVNLCQGSGFAVTATFANEFSPTSSQAGGCRLASYPGHTHPSWTGNEDRCRPAVVSCEEIA